MALQQQALASGGGGGGGAGAGASNIGGPLSGGGMGGGGGGGGGSSNDAYSALVFSGQRGAEWIRDALMSTSRATSAWPQAHGCGAAAAAAALRAVARAARAHRHKAADRSRAGCARLLTSPFPAAAAAGWAARRPGPTRPASRPRWRHT